ncbi:cellulose binding domain-containing protein, partial [Micromonospora endophytica]
MSRRRIRSILAACVAAVLAAVGLTVTTASAAAGCRVTYSVTNEWPGGFGANVNVDNLGDPINGWRLTWSFGAGQTITQLWSGSHTQSGANVTVTNASWNAGIPTNGSVSFGFNAAMSGTNNPVPTSFTLNGTVCTGTTNPTTGPPTTSPSPT